MNVRQTGNYPLDNLTYDLMNIIAEKSKALEAYDHYLQDAQGNERVRQSLEKIRQQDTDCIGELSRHLSYMMGNQKQQGSGSSMSGSGSGSGSSR